MQDQKDLQLELENARRLLQDAAARVEQLEARLAADQHRRVIEAQTDLICRYDTNFTLTFVNRAYAELYSKNPEELIGQNFFALMQPNDRAIVEQHIGQLSAANPLLSNEHPTRFANGNLLWIQWTDRALLDANDNIVEYQGVGRDITQRKLAEQENLRLYKAINQYAANLEQRVVERTIELQSAKERVEAILNNSVDGIVLIQHDLRIQEANTAFEKLFRCSEPEYISKLLIDYVDPVDVNLLLTTMQQSANKEHGQTIEMRARRNDGSGFDAEISIGALKDTGLVCTLRDITKRKAQERQLRYYASLQASVTDAVISTDLDFRIQSWNQAAERIYGWRAEEVIGTVTLDFLRNPSGSQIVRNQAVAAIAEQGTWSGDVVRRRKDGGEIHLLLTVTKLKDENGLPFGIVAIGHDISERKQTEAALQAKIAEEHAFQVALKALHEITVELTQVDELDRFYRLCVERGLQRLGFERLALFLYDSEHELAIGTYGVDEQGKLISEYHIQFNPAASSLTNGILKKALENNERFSFEAQVDLFTGIQVIGTGWNAVAALWDGKRSLGWLVTDNAIHHHPASKPLMDILALYSMSIGTLLARKHEQIALRESEEKFRMLLEEAPQAIVISDSLGRITLVNSEAENVFGYQRDELNGQMVESLVLEEQRTLHVQHRLDYKDAPHRRSGGMVPEVPAKRKDGSSFLADIRLSYIKTQNEMLVMSFVSDVTDLKRTEEALHQSLKKEKELNELKSRFVMMASHEFRTPLATILAVTESLSIYRHRLSDEKIEERLEKIKDQIAHLKGIMDDVLLLAQMQARRAEFNPTQFDLDRLCRTILEEFQSQSDFHHRLQYHCHGAKSEFQLDKKLIRQIFSNLLSNAIKYSPVTTVIMINLDFQAEIVNLTVADQGIGIPEDDLQHLFEPFHRASNVGAISGTGLGLVIAKESVALHGGDITVQSQVGLGSSFIITLPITQGNVEQ